MVQPRTTMTTAETLYSVDGRCTMQAPKVFARSIVMPAQRKRTIRQEGRQGRKKNGKGTRARRMVLVKFPHSRAGRPQIVGDIVGTPA